MKPRIPLNNLSYQALIVMALLAALEAPALSPGRSDTSESKKITTEPSTKKSKSPKRPKTINLEALRMMEKIEMKAKELKKREEQVQIREAQLKTLEAEVKKDLQKIEAALEKSKELMNVSTNLREENLKSLVKIYSSMRPDDAAPLVAALDEKIAIQILSRMKSKIAGQVMGKLDTQSAKKLSEKIIGTDIFGKAKK